MHRPPDPQSIDPFVVGPEILQQGRRGAPLQGARFAVKDLFDVVGTRRGDGNPDKLAESPVALASAPAVQALVDAGADCVGKTVTDELAYSLSGTNVHYGTPLNPAVPGAVPGGSSSGSASAVASGDVDIALGTDTGGSTRVPASYCGVFGLRTTRGRISSDGVMLLAPSFCSTGILARNPDRLLGAWAAVREGASTSTQQPVARPPEVLVIARGLFALADPDASDALHAASLRLAASVGLPAVEEEVVDPAETETLCDAFRTIQMFEAWQTHGAWIETHPGSLGAGIAARFAAAAKVTNEQATEARATQRAFQTRFERVLHGGRYLLQPAASGPAPAIHLAPMAKDELRARTLKLTCVAGLVGAPALAMPLARVAGGPVGLALVGLPGDDDAVVDLASRPHGREHRT